MKKMILASLVIFACGCETNYQDPRAHLSYNEPKPETKQVTEITKDKPKDYSHLPKNEADTKRMMDFLRQADAAQLIKGIVYNDSLESANEVIIMVDNA